MTGTHEAGARNALPRALSRYRRPSLLSRPEFAIDVGTFAGMPDGNVIICICRDLMTRVKFIMQSYPNEVFPECARAHFICASSAVEARSLMKKRGSAALATLQASTRSSGSILRSQQSELLFVSWLMKPFSSRRVGRQPRRAALKLVALRAEVHQSAL